MATNLEYAQMSTIVYRNISYYNAPDGWEKVSEITDLSGLYAEAFRNGSEIVISIRGTDGDFLTDPDWYANNLLPYQFQYDQAAAFVDTIKAANPGATITFTGHSPGGAIAGLLAAESNIRGRAAPCTGATSSNGSSISSSTSGGLRRASTNRPGISSPPSCSPQPA